VIGHYKDTGLLYCSINLHAETPDAAAALVAELYPDEDIAISAVIAGEHESVLEGEYLLDTSTIRSWGTDDEGNGPSVSAVVRVPDNSNNEVQSG